MNKLNFLNKLRKKRLDRKRKKQIKKRHKKIIRQINDSYLKNKGIEFRVRKYFNPMYSNILTFEEYDFLKKYLDELCIKYSELTSPSYVQKGQEFTTNFHFIYEEDLNE